MNVRALDVWVVALASAGALVDLRSRRIPNALTVPAMAVGVVALANTQGWDGVLAAGAGIAIATALLVVPFALRWVGGGDVKFLMAFGACLGPRGALEAFLWATAAGGLLAVAMLGVTSSGRERVLTSWIQFKNLVYTRDVSLLKPTPRNATIGVPYGVALAIGGVTARLCSGILLG